MRWERFRRVLAGILGMASWAMLVPLPALAQDAAAGRSLFESFCVSCHGMPPAGGPDRAGNNPTMIANAINGRVPAMAFLRGVVTSQDILNIAAYLGTLSGGGTPPAIVPGNDYSDLWWNEAEPGWGLNLIQHPSHQVFGVMYTYDATRKPMWLVIPGGTWVSSSIFTGSIYRVTGPPPTSAFDPSRVAVRAVGTATLSFTDRNRGTIAFSVDGVAVSKAITRQPF